MPSAICERAIEEATVNGNAILKFISPNDVGITGSHQCGFYLPKSVWEMFSPYPPRKGVNNENPVRILWPDGRETSSRVKWYGGGTRSEYRLTRFGKDFPWLAPDTVGDLLVLIPKNHGEFIAFVLDLDEDIEEVQAALGIEPFQHWGVFRHGEPQVETEDDCMARGFREFAKLWSIFPTGKVFSEEARRVLLHCLKSFQKLNPDDSLMKCMETEYQLFRFVERQICQPEISRLFKDVEDFLQTAATIMNRRKARAGRSLENHVEQLLISAGIPHQMRPPNVDGRPDIILPSEQAYNDPKFPREKLIMIGVKTTCKDRWRQVLNEGRQIKRKHILTIQPGISGKQLEEMHSANVTLIVPKKLHKEYPKTRTIQILTLEGFIQSIERSVS